MKGRTYLESVQQVVSLHNSFLRSRVTELASGDVRDVLISAVHNALLRPGREPGDGAFSVPLDVAMNCPHVRWDRNQQTCRWREMLYSPVSDRWWKAQDGHADVLMMAALSGASSKDPFTLRYQTRPRLRQVCRPYWAAFHGGVDPGLG